MINDASFTLAGNLLALMSDAKGAGARLAELAELERQAAQAESVLAEKVAALALHRVSVSAELEKLRATVADRRMAVEALEGAVAEMEATLTTSEHEWTGLGMPEEAPEREAIFRLRTN